MLLKYYQKIKVFAGTHSKIFFKAAKAVRPVGQVGQNAVKQMAPPICLYFYFPSSAAAL